MTNQPTAHVHRPCWSTGRQLHRFDGYFPLHAGIYSSYVHVGFLFN